MIEAASDSGSDCEVPGDYCYTEKEHFISGSLAVLEVNIYIHLHIPPYSALCAMGVSTHMQITGFSKDRFF